VLLCFVVREKKQTTKLEFSYLREIKKKLNCAIEGIPKVVTRKELAAEVCGGRHEHTEL